MLNGGREPKQLHGRNRAVGGGLDGPGKVNRTSLVTSDHAPHPGAITLASRGQFGDIQTVRKSSSKVHASSVAQRATLSTPGDDAFFAILPQDGGVFCVWRNIFTFLS